MSEEKEQESVNQLLNGLVFQTLKLEDIPFDRIRNSEAVQIHLRELVTRAYLDRNYTREQTKIAFDQVLICIITQLLKPPSEEEKASIEEGTTDSVAKLAADLESGKKRPAPILPPQQQIECPPEIVDQIEEQLQRP